MNSKIAEGSHPTHPTERGRKRKKPMAIGHDGWRPGGGLKDRAFSAAWAVYRIRHGVPYSMVLGMVPHRRRAGGGLRRTSPQAI